MGNSWSTSSSSQGEDRISDLPEFILHNILYRLSIKNSTRMSAVSKTWRRVQSSRPNLRYLAPEYLKEKGFLDADRHLNLVACVDEFMGLVDRHLQRFSDQHNGFRIRSFELAMYTSPDRRWSGLVDSWVKIALEKDVAYLTLWLSGSPDSPYNRSSPKVPHVLDEDLFGCHKRFVRLQVLDLDGVSLSENLIDNFIQSCPFISCLSLSRFTGLKVLRISRLTCLDTVDLIDTPAELEQIHIDAPSLKYAYIEHGTSDNDVISRCSYNLDSCRELKDIELIGSCLSNTSFESFISRFRFLEFLMLSNNESERISISSPRLKQVTLWCCPKMVRAEIDAPNLSKFIYGGYDLYTFPRLCLENTRCISKLSLLLTRKCPIHTLWFTKLREFIGKSSHIKDIEIDLHQETEVTFDLQVLEKTPLPCLPEVECLRFDMVDLTDDDTVPSDNDFRSLLDGLLWSCRPNAVFVKWNSNVGNEFKKLVHKKLLNRWNPSCCISNNVKCWKHFVKDAKITSFREIDNSAEYPSWKQLFYDLSSIVSEIKFT